MSSNLTSLVPVLDGTNYQDWSVQMQSFLLSAGQWKCAKPGATIPTLKESTTTTTRPGETEESPSITTVTTSDNSAEVKEWSQDIEKALGNIRLRLSRSIQHQYAEEEDPASLWNSLKEKYGSPGMPTAFLEFKGIMDTVIPNGSDPSPSIDKILTHFTRLSSMKWAPPGEFIAMILLSKAPAYMESTIQVLISGLKDEIEQDGSPTKPDLGDVVQAMIQSFETSRRQGTKNTQQNQQQKAHKLSTVKPWDNQSQPQFQQQQQQDRSFKKGRRGKRGGRKNNQQQLQNAMVDAVPQQQQQAQQPSFIPPPPPTFQFQAGPSSGFFSNSIAHHVRPSVQFPPPNSEFKTPYRSFKMALELAKAIGVRPTTEVLRTLEIPALLKEEKEAKQPNKRPRRENTHVEIPLSHANLESRISKGKGKETSDDVVSLYTEDEEMVEGEPTQTVDPLTVADFEMDAQYEDNADFGDDFFGSFGVSTCFHIKETTTDVKIQTGAVDNLSPCYVTINNCGCPSSNKCDETVEWLADSGASMHFTFDINDFVEYQELAQKIPVTTANSFSQIIGKGTVVLHLQNGESVRIFPVYHTPDLTVRLLSLGVFMQMGFHIAGTREYIAVMQKTKPFLLFHPRLPKDSIFVVRALKSQDAKIFGELGTIHSVDYETLHRRMAHPSKDVIKKARKHLKDFPNVVIPEEDHICPGCLKGKMVNRPFLPTERRATKPFQLIHSDLKSFPIDSYHKYKYSIIFFDDYTSHAWTVNMRTKNAAIAATSRFLAMVETQYNSRVVQWMSDAGGEYKSTAFDNMLKDRGIMILQSVPYAHQQNGRAERIIRTLMEKAESMQQNACLPPSWWEFAIEHATHVYNRTPLRRLNWQTPSQLLLGERPSVNHLHVFGCGAYVFIPAEIRANKLAPKSELMTYLGNAPAGYGFMFMRSPNNVLFYATHCVFDEILFPRCPKQGQPSNTRLLEPAPPNRHSTHDAVPPPEDVGELLTPWRKRTSVRTRTAIQEPRAQDQPAQDNRSTVPEPSHSQRMQDPDSPEESSSSTSSSEEEREPSPPPAPTRLQRTKKVPTKLTKDSVYGDRHPVEILKPQGRKGQRKAKEAAQRPCAIENQPPPDAPVPGPSTEIVPDINPTPSEIDVEEGLLRPRDVSDDEAESYKELGFGVVREGGVPVLSLLLAKSISPMVSATSDPKSWGYKDVTKLPQSQRQEWHDACLRELEALKKRNVFELVECPRNRKVIKNRWVFDVKSDGRKRARLVAKGFSQIEGLDYDQVFSPVVRFETVRLILAMAALGNWHITRLDVRNAFLYGELEEEIYMEQPEGFHVPGREREVLKLLRALYGLKQAGLAWWRTLRESMIKLGFTGLTSDAGLFIWRNEHTFVIAVIYVDDSIFCGPDKELVNALKAKFMARWECRDLGDVTEFLRMRIVRKGSKVQIDQCAYLETVLERCGMQNCKFAATPLPAGYIPEPVSPDTVIDPELRSRYQTVIGSLLYLTLGTRPDIAFAVTKLAQFAARPTKEHLNKALYICRYLAGTRNYNTEYDGSGGEGLIACTDSDWASDHASPKSQTGFFLKLAGGAISWTSRAQRTIALSSTEAEYMVLSDCSRQVVWMHTLLGELSYPLYPIPICGDNQGSIFIASNPVTEKRSKHIDIRYHYIQEVVERKLVEIYFIDGDKNPADLLTKNLGHIKFLQFRPAYGLHFFNTAKAIT